MKLTNKLKEQIVANVVAKFDFIGKRDKILEEEKKWALKYVNSKIPEEFKKVSKKHPEWFRTISSFCADRNSAKWIFKHEDKYGHYFIDLCDNIPVPCNLLDDWRGMSADETPFVKKAQKLVDEVNELKNKTYCYLNSCTTVKRLIELYPDIKPFIPSDSGGTSTAVALPSQSFSEMLSEYVK